MVIIIENFHLSVLQRCLFFPKRYQDIKFTFSELQKRKNLLSTLVREDAFAGT